MLTFLTGLQTDEKHRYINKKIVSLLKENKQVILLVPEQAAFDRERDFLFTYGELLSNRLKVTSFTHFSEDILELYGNAIKPKADKTAQAVLMSLALEQTEEQLTLYKRYAGKLGLVNRLLSSYRQFKQTGVTPKQLKKTAALLSGQLKQKVTELSLIFSAYEALLTPRFSDETDNLAVAQQALTQNYPFADTVFFFDDFRGYTVIQLLFINRLIASGSQTYVSVFAPDLINSEENEPFFHALENADRIKQSAKLSGIRVFEENTDIPDNSPFSYLRNGMLRPLKKSCPDSVEEIELLTAPTRETECETVALTVIKLLKSGKYRLRDIGVLTREEAYIPKLTAVLRKFSIPVFEDKTVPLFASPLIRFVLGSVNLAAFGLDTEQLLSVLKTGISGFTPEECSRLETYAFRWQIKNSRWLQPFTGHPDGFGAKKTSESEQELAELNELRERAVSPLRVLSGALKTEEPKTALKAVWQYLETVNASEHYKSYAESLLNDNEEEKAIECARIWDTLADILDALYRITETGRMAPARLYELLRFMLLSDSSGTVPAGIDELVIGLADRTRFLNAKVLFILGCNDGIFPKTALPDSVFSPAQLRILSLNGLPEQNLPEQKYAEERLIVLGALFCAQKKLYVSYSKTDDGGNELMPSEIVTGLKEIFPRIRQTDHRDIPTEQTVQSFESGFEVYARADDRNSVFARSLKTALLQNEDIKNKLTLLYNAENRSLMSFYDPEIAEELFGKNIKASASRIECYHKCPFMHFCRYGLKIEKPQISQIDPRINGLMIHAVLEKLLPLLNTPNTELTDEELRQRVHEFIAAYTKENLCEQEELPLHILREIDRTEYKATEILKRLRREFGTCSFLPYAMELKIGNSREGISAYILPMPDGSTVTLTGSIDRVDIMEAENDVFVRVIDYKTGGKKFALADVFNGLNMQMLLYLFAFLKNGANAFPGKRLLPAGILYVPANTSGEKLGRRCTEEEIIRQKLENGRMNGLYLESETVIKGMEADPRGLYIDATIDEKGKMHGLTLPLRDFRTLNKKTDEILIKTCMDIKAGKIRVAPVKDTYRCACDHCDFSSVCLHEDSDGYATPAVLSEKDAKALLKEESNNE